MAKAVVFFAEGTEECEALLVVDLLRRAKVEVLVASASGSREILSSHKVHITADALAFISPTPTSARRHGWRCRPQVAQAGYILPGSAVARLGKYHRMTSISTIRKK